MNFKNFSVLFLLALSFTLSFAVPSLTAPTPGGALPYPNTGVVTFTFDDVASMTVTEYKLFVGTCSGGACSKNIYDSTVSFGPIPADVSGTTMHTVTVIPTDGSHIFVTLWYKEAGGTFTKIVYEYEATGDPSIDSPTDGSTFTYNRVTFTWDDNFAPVVEYNLIVGTTSGGSDIADSGVLTAATETLLVNRDNTIPPFVGLPIDGSTIFVSLGFNTSAGAPFTYVDYTYTAAGTSVTAPTIVSPAPGPALTGTSVTFTLDTLDPAITSVIAVVKTQTYTATDIFGPFDVPLGAPSFTVDPSTTLSPFVGLPNDGSLISVGIRYFVGKVAYMVTFDYTSFSGTTLPFTRTFRTGSLDDFATTNTAAGVTSWVRSSGTVNTVASPGSPPGDYASGTRSLYSSPLIPTTGITDFYVHIGVIHEFDFADPGDTGNLSVSVDGGPRTPIASFSGTSGGEITEIFSIPSLPLVGGTDFQVHFEIESDGAGTAEGWILDAVIVSSTPTFPGALVVTTTADAGPGSLREAVMLATPGSTILFDVAATPTITLTGPELVIDKDLKIVGLGVADLAISGELSDRVIHVLPGVSARITDVTITFGDTTTSMSPSGGGIWNEGDLSLFSANLLDNLAIGGEGGGLYNTGTAFLKRCRIGSLVSPNIADTDGGGISNDGIIVLQGCIIEGNSATGDDGGGIYNDSGFLTILGSAIIGNTADDDGGGIRVQGSASDLIVTNTTISGNFTTTGAGAGVRISAGSDITFDHCTITENLAAMTGGGLFNSSTAVALVITNTIIAGNLATPPTDDVDLPAGAEPVAPSGFNFIGNGVGGWPPALPGEVPDVTVGITIVLPPILAALADNGGPTPTHAFLGPNPAIDGAVASILPVDQRGFFRGIAAPNDIGAFELGAVPLP